MKIRLPIASGSGSLLFENLTSTNDGVTVTWTATRTIPNGTVFHLLANQTLEVIPAQATGGFIGTFTVARSNP